MKSKCIGRTYLLCLIFSYVKYSTTQYQPVFRNASKKDACDGANKSALVEHFFNVIFTEFHSSPPVCVCVQMCSDQPTYCYPNGCLKKVDSKKKTPEEKPAQGTNIQNVDAVNKMFLVDDKNDFTQMLNEHAEGGKNAPPRTSAVKDMRPDPFKDRYKILFKYKKMPKVELRYNLREQVKNMKSDILKVETKDVSKTRWPNVNHMGFNQQRVHKANEKKIERIVEAGDVNPKHFISNSESYTSKYFKRDLRGKPQDDVDIQAEYLTDNPLDSKNFSIETLIENLIGNNYEGKRDVDADSNVVADGDNKISEVTVKTETEESANITKNNQQTCVVSMNMTNQNLDENKYIEDSPLVKARMNLWKNYTFNEMIAALAKRIDKQNNTSMEILKHISTENNVLPSENLTNFANVSDTEKTQEDFLRKNIKDKIQAVVVTNDSGIKKKSQESYQKQTQITLK